MDLFLHRAWIVAISPLMWAFALVVYVADAPLAASEQVWLGIKRHWNDQ